MAKMNPWYEMFAKGMVDPRQAAALEAQNASQEDPTGTIGNMPVERDPANIVQDQNAAIEQQAASYPALAAVAAKGKAEAKDSLTQAGTSQTVTPVIPDLEDAKKFFTLVDEAKKRPENLKAQAQIDSQEQFLQKYMSAPIGFDFKTAIGGLASFYPESSAANLYKILPANDTTATRAKTINAIQGALDKSKAGLYKNVLDTVKPLMSGATVREIASNTRKTEIGVPSPVKPDSFGKRNDDINRRNFLAALTKQTAPFDSQYVSLQDLISLDEKSPMSVGVLKSKIARGLNAEKGVLTEGDIQRSNVSQALKDRMMQFLSLSENGTVPPELFSTAKQFAKEYADVQTQHIKDTALNLADQYKNLGDYRSEANSKISRYKPLELPKSSAPVTFKDILNKIK